MMVRKSWSGKHWSWPLIHGS